MSEEITTRMRPTRHVRRARRAADGPVLVVIDVLVGAALAAGLWLTVPPTSSAAGAAQFMLAILALFGLLLRRRVPWTATALAGVATAAAWWLGLTGDPFLIAAVCLYTAAERHGARRFPWWLTAAVSALLLSSLVLSSDGIESAIRGALTVAAVLGASWSLGARTQQLTQQTAERVRAQERQRMSRDVHDVLSHTLGAVGVRAGVAAHLQAPSTELLRDTLREIEADSRAALIELRSLMSAERNDGDPMSPEAALRTRIDDASRAARRIGIELSVEFDAAAEALPAIVQTIAHRVVQESITNVIRHSGATRCWVMVIVEPSGLVVEVRDDGDGAAMMMREGLGLRGMRERLVAVGGTLRAEDLGHGFLVRAEIPGAARLAGTT